MTPDDSDDRELFARLRALDHPAPRVTAGELIARAEVTGRRRIRWAAGLLLALGAAGAAYAIPGSPLRGWVNALLGGGGGKEPAPLPPPPAPPAGGLSFVPERRLRIALRAHAAGRIRVSFSDSAQVSVSGPPDAASFTYDVDRLVIDNRGDLGTTSQFEVQLPRTLADVEIFVETRRVFVKRGARVTNLRLVCSQGRTIEQTEEDTVSTRAIYLSMLAAGSAACSSATGPSYNPDIPATFVAAVTNQFFPLLPGTTFNFSAQTSGGLETTTVEVLATTRVVHGVTATVVRDRVYLNGSLIEDTFDWYAQDAFGNVWYLGEDSKEIQNGQVISTDGSWEWGVNGALPGIVMWADPSAHIGAEYRQEYYKGHAEDWAKVVSVSETVSVPFGQRTNCIKTEDWNGLESGGREYKYYCAGVGLALETPVSGAGRTELVSRTP